MSKAPAQTEPVSVWPSGGGWTVGILAMSPDEIEQLYGIGFEQGRDDLDGYRIAAIEEPQVGQFWLFAHDHAPLLPKVPAPAVEQVRRLFEGNLWGRGPKSMEPGSGTEIVVDRKIRRDEALGAVWRTMGIDERGFAWLSPHQTCPEEQAS